MYKFTSITDIREKAVLGYIRSVWKGLFICINIILLTELFMFFTMSDHASDLISLWMPERWLFDFPYFKRHIIIPTIVNYSTFIVLIIVSKNVKSLKAKESMLALDLFELATMYVFGHYGMFYLSIIFIMPILLTTPFQKTINTLAFILGSIALIMYYFYQQSVKYDWYNIFIASTNFCVVCVGYVISRSLRSTFDKMIISNYTAVRDANTDALTGLLNRSAYNKRLNDVKYVKAIAFIDVDHFKTVNDVYGHDMGDRVLQLVAKCLKQLSAYSDGIYRFGGDEFTFLSNVPGQDCTRHLIQMKDSFKKRAKQEYGIDVSISIGVKNLNNETSLAEIIKSSDEVMYKSKEAGRNTVTFED